jgi:hypothetical protein
VASDVRVFRAGIASALAHDHVVRAARWRGTLLGAIRNQDEVEIVVTVVAAPGASR